MVITISRQYGSGGRLIGRKIAQELGFYYFDREIIHLAAEKSGLSPQFIEALEEKKPQSFLMDLVAPYGATAPIIRYDPPIGDKAFFAQADVIRELAHCGDCVIVGRSADYILRGKERLFTTFLYASKKDRLRRITEDYGVDPKEAPDKLVKVDRMRAAHRKFYTGEKWDSAAIYDLSLNTETIGVEGTVQTIATAVRNAIK